MTRSAAITDIGQVNPSLAVEAHFRALLDGRDLTTVFRLEQEPELAIWLLSFADNRLAQLGRPGASEGIPPPPGGDLRERLVVGGVILRAQRPDGGEALSLNSKQNVWLNARVRLPGQPSRTTAIPIFEDPDTARWLLLQYIDARHHGVAEVPLAESSVATLRQLGALVDEVPPPDAYFPDPAGTQDLAAELAVAADCYLQPAGEAIPAAVLRLLGRHAPQLPPNNAVVWGRDAGTGIVFPSLLPAGVSDDRVREAAGADAAQREARWRRQREAARESLRGKRYAVLREIIPPEQRRMLRTYVRQLVERGYFPALDDGQVKLRAAIHNEPTIASLHQGLAHLLTDVAGEKLLASYCYLSHYVGGAVLERHVDRAQCAYNLSVVFDMFGAAGAAEPWPIYLELDGAPLAVNLGIGDGLMYSGTEIPHWRDALADDQQAVVCFFHFVPEDFDGALH